MVTRGFGDADLKGISPQDSKEDIEQKINYDVFSCDPEIFEYFMNPFKDEFIVVGSDGLFE